MDLPVPDDLRFICREIVAEEETDDEWSEIEADDWCQTDTVTGRTLAEMSPPLSF